MNHIFPPPPKKKRKRKEKAALDIMLPIAKDVFHHSQEASLAALEDEDRHVYLMHKMLTFSLGKW